MNNGKHGQGTICTKIGADKGQLNSDWIYEFIVSPKMQTKNCKKKQGS